MPPENNVLSNTLHDAEVNRIRTPPSRNAVALVLRTLLAEIGNFTHEEMADSATLDGALALESIALVELQVAIEDRFDIHLDPLRIVELNSLGLIVDYIQAVASMARPGANSNPSRDRV